jgi:dolichol-phosphate mannosyltransferase
VKFGIFVSIISFIVGLYYTYLYLIGRIEVLGYASLIISIWFLSGIVLTSIGITGIYIGKIFDQVKNRPIYVIDEKYDL